MHWKQFFTPVKSMKSDEAQEFLRQTDDVTLLDVRQPGEYQESHLPGAKLIPLPQLSNSLDQLEKNKPILVYCAIGGRSRVAAQQLAGEGFTKIINLKGGIKAWNGEQAHGDIDQGLELFTDLESTEAILKTAYSLEEGLQDFYIDMMQHATHEDVITLFRKLSDIEDIHKERVYKEYVGITGKDDRKAFQDDIEKSAMEGGMTTEEYLQLFKPDLAQPTEVIGLAMSIEAQAQDLYTRAARLAKTDENARVLEHIAKEETYHLEQLGTLMDQLMEESHG